MGPCKVLPAVDVAVAGGGAAGALVALLLAQEGAAVAVVDAGGGSERLEGLSPRVAGYLRRQGLGDLPGLGDPPAPRRAQWGGSAARRNREHLVARPAFERALQRRAAAAGACLLTDRVRRIETRERSVRLQLADGGDVVARLAIDARGRRAPRPRGCPRGPLTVAISAFRTGRSPDPETRIVACPDGWIWAAQPAQGRPMLQAVCDAEDLPGRGRTAASRMLRRLAAQAGMAFDPDGEILVRDAGMVLAGPRFDPRLFAIGDAAIAVDPLSGHGIFWAVSSAVAAVPIVRAVLSGDPAATALAARFHQDRLVAAFWRQARIARDFYRAEPRFADRRFWRRRAAWPDEMPAHAAAAAPSLTRRVVVEDGVLKEAEVVVTAQEPEGVAWIAGLPIAPIVRRCLERGGAEGDDLEAFQARFAPDSSREQAALCRAWLQARGILGAGPDAGISDGGGG